MRYFAAIGDPNGFQENGFTPSQTHYNPLRRVELFNSQALSVVAARSAYQKGVATNVVDGKPVAAHIYEYTTQSTSHDVWFLSFLTPSAISVTAEQDQRLKERNCPSVGHPLLGGEPEDQPPPHVPVLKRVLTHSSTQRLCPPCRRYHGWSRLDYHLWEVLDMDSNVGSVRRTSSIRGPTSLTKLCIFCCNFLLSWEFDASGSMLCPRMILVARVRCRSTSSVKQWWSPSFAGLSLRVRGMVLARTSLQQTM